MKNKRVGVRGLQIISALMISAAMVSGCGQHTDTQPPAAPCTIVSLAGEVVIATGFDTSFQTVNVQLFLKNSRFDSLLGTFTVPVAPPQNGTSQRFITLPGGVSSNFDLRFVFSDSIAYSVSGMSTGWIQRHTNESVVYECCVVSRKINGKSDPEGYSNLVLLHPDF